MGVSEKERDDEPIVCGLAVYGSFRCISPLFRTVAASGRECSHDLHLLSVVSVRVCAIDRHTVLTLVIKRKFILLPVSS